MSYVIRDRLLEYALKEIYTDEHGNLYERDVMVWPRTQEGHNEIVTELANIGGSLA